MCGRKLSDSAIVEMNKEGRHVVEYRIQKRLEAWEIANVDILHVSFSTGLRCFPRLKILFPLGLWNFSGLSHPP